MYLYCTALTTHISTPAAAKAKGATQRRALRAHRPQDLCTFPQLSLQHADACHGHRSVPEGNRRKYFRAETSLTPLLRQQNLEHRSRTGEGAFSRFSGSTCYPFYLTTEHNRPNTASKNLRFFERANQLAVLHSAATSRGARHQCIHPSTP